MATKKKNLISKAPKDRKGNDPTFEDFEDQLKGRDDEL
jgi:hypothetical protein